MKICQICGCTELRACADGCYWFDAKTCSRCVEKAYGLSGMIAHAWMKWMWQQDAEDAWLSTIAANPNLRGEVSP